MKATLSLLWALSLSATVAFSQELKKDLAYFEKIIVSPKINVVLVKGDHESIRVVYSNVSPGDINMHVNGNTLHLFLTDARFIEKRKRIYENTEPRRVSIYKYANVTAYVTYRALKRLEVRGEQEVSIDSLVTGDKFKLKAYGEAELYLAGMKTEKFKAVLYGRNKLRINSGNVESQKFRLYGENRINTRPLTSTYASSRIYGEGKLALSASNRFRITSFGEPYIEINGMPKIRRGIMIGRTHLEVR